MITFDLFEDMDNESVDGYYTRLMARYEPNQHIFLISKFMYDADVQKSCIEEECILDKGQVYRVFNELSVYLDQAIARIYECNDVEFLLDSIPCAVSKKLLVDVGFRGIYFRLNEVTISYTPNWFVYKDNEKELKTKTVAVLCAFNNEIKSILRCNSLVH